LFPLTYAFSRDRYSVLAERILLITLTGLGLSFFFSSWGVSRFSMWSLYVLLIWRFVVGYEPVRRIPKSLLVITVLYLLGFIISAFVSDVKTNVVWALKDYRLIFLAGLLFTAPLSDRARRFLIYIFFIGSALGGLLGILQYFGLFLDTFRNHRALGLSQHPVIYGTQMALVSGVALLSLLLTNGSIKISRNELLLVSATILLSIAGMLFSQSRGVWLAFVTASSVTLLLYNFRKGLLFILLLIVSSSLAFSLSSTLKERAVSIAAAAVDPETDAGSAGIRLKLWKGALMIFRESPLFGTGIGDFNSDINRLAKSRQLRGVPPETRGNAHSSYFHTLATRGIVGFVLLISLYTSIMIFALKEIKNNAGPGGYVINFITIVLIVGGLTVPYLGGIGMTLVLAQYCFIFGVLGPMRWTSKKN
jgi:O-antigen ligase